MRALIVSAFLFAGVAGPAMADVEREVDLGDDGVLRVDARGLFAVTLISGDVADVRLIGPEGELDEVRVSVRNDEIRLRQRAYGILRSRRDLRVRVEVTAPMLERLEFGEGVQAVGDDLNLEDVRIDISTGANARLSGQCEEVRVSASTGGSLNARELVCDSVSIDASTGASASVNASDSVEASASTGASVAVYGSADRQDFSSILGGSVSRR